MKKLALASMVAVAMTSSIGFAAQTNVQTSTMNMSTVIPTMCDLGTASSTTNLTTGADFNLVNPTAIYAGNEVVTYSFEGAYCNASNTITLTSTSDGMVHSTDNSQIIDYVAQTVNWGSGATLTTANTGNNGASNYTLGQLGSNSSTVANGDALQVTVTTAAGSGAPLLAGTYSDILTLTIGIGQ